jgi:polyisoprenoid-binding protein YceI
MPITTRHRSVAVASAVLLASALAHAGLSKPAGPSVKFTALGPAGLKIEGTTHEMDLVEDGSNVVLTVRLVNLDTGISVRDKHTKDCLEVEKFPEAKLTVARSAFKLPGSGDAPATLALHGKSLPTSVHYEIKSDGGSFQVDGKLRVNIKDAGMTAPSYLGVTVKPDVDVEAHFKVNGS